jgi:uncharacterized protein DUF3562
MDSRNAINELARQTRKPLEEVAAVYERERARLDAQATVKTFVDVLAKRRAQELLRPH